VSCRRTIRDRIVLGRFRSTHARLGFLEGQNLDVDFVNLGGQLDRYADQTRKLVARKPDIIIAPGNELAVKSAVEATNKVPIVMVAIDYDPIALGYVAGLARPGKNVTGLFSQQIELTAKRLQLLKDAFPELKSADFVNRIAKGAKTFRSPPAIHRRSRSHRPCGP
jgi:putative tryptophan/tyrosine transport system substrate-binding protein